MSARLPAVPDEGGALIGPQLRALRDAPVQGISRRTLLRRSLGLGVALVLAEGVAGSIAFLWTVAGGGGTKFPVGTLDDLVATNAGIPIREGFPVYFAAAKAFIVVVDPKVGRFLPGIDDHGEGILNVRVLSQRCPHLGCRPNPCIEDYWFHCPCHQSRYDRLGIKPGGVAYGPAERGMDRFAVEVNADGVLTIDTSRVFLGPLPIPLGQPGVIPPRVLHGCA